MSFAKYIALVNTMTYLNMFNKIFCLKGLFLIKLIDCSESIKDNLTMN